MSRSNAERQKAYRDRKRNARNAPKAQIVVTGRDTTKDIWLENEDQLCFLGDWGYGPQYARVKSAR